MKHIDFHLDFISPYAYLAFEHLPEALEGLSYSVAYKPMLLGAVLKHHGQLGPAEIAAKCTWTYRHVLWLGHAHGVPIEMPASHPYNPLPHLRLALATTADGDISRHVAETLFREVWRGGDEAGELHLTWRETGGPPVTRPARSGFGSRLIERGLAAELGGSAQIRFEPTGVVCEISAGPVRPGPPAPAREDAFAR